MGDPLISTAELDEWRADPALVVLDTSYYLPNENTDARALFASSHIPGADFLDLDAVSDNNTALPHMVPSADRFADAVALLGVSQSSDIVVYDQRGLFSAPRIWWLFTLFGHRNIRVLDGGLPKWQREGRATASGIAHPRAPGVFSAHEDGTLVRNRSEIEANLRSRAEIILDARAPGRFSGQVTEPRPGVRSGHVPGARSVPFFDLLQADGTMLSPSALRAYFESLGLDRDDRLVTMCGSGVTAAVVTLALVRAGWPIGTLYDGSWSEWGSAADTPVERDS